MKLKLITLQVLVNEADAAQVSDSMNEWFYNHEVGMEWHDIHWSDIDTVELDP